MLLVKAFIKHRAEQRRFGDINHELRRLEIRKTMIGRWFGLAQPGVLQVGPALLRWSDQAAQARQR